MLGVDHMFFINVKIKGMVRVLGVMRVAAQGLRPADDLADILNNGFTFGQILQSENAIAMDAGATGLNAPAGQARGLLKGFWGHCQKLCVMLKVHTCARTRTRVGSVDCRRVMP